MIAQAEGLRFAVEHYRQRKPHCSGTLIWQLNDCWPVLSWSLVDYYGFGKAGYYAVRRAYAPVLASFKQEGERASLWLTNDMRTAVADTATVTLRTFAGETLWAETVSVQAAANSNGAVWSRSLNEDEAAIDRYLAVESASGLFTANRCFFGEVKDLALPTVTPSLKLTQVNPHELAAELSADRYAYFVHLIVPHEATRFSDNYFDLAPGVVRVIHITNPELALNPGMVTLSWLDRQKPA
jgi:beta-mannosidase